MSTASLQRGKTLSNKCPGYDPKPSDGEAPVLKLWGMWSAPSLPLLPGPFWLGVAGPVMVLSMDQIELFNYLLYLKPFNCVQINDWCEIELLVFHNNTYEILETVCKWMNYVDKNW